MNYTNFVLIKQTTHTCLNDSHLQFLTAVRLSIGMIYLKYNIQALDMLHYKIKSHSIISSVLFHAESLNNKIYIIPMNLN